MTEDREVCIHLLTNGTLLSLKAKPVVQWFAIFSAVLLKVWSPDQLQEHQGELAGNASLQVPLQTY